jgi:hypothetical protein
VSLEDSVPETVSAYHLLGLQVSHSSQVGGGWTFRDVVCVFEGVRGIFEGCKGDEVNDTRKVVEIF